MHSWRVVVDELTCELGALRAFEVEVDSSPDFQLHPAVISARTKVALAASAVERANLYVENSIVAEARRALARAQEAVGQAREVMWAARPSQPRGLRLVGSGVSDVGPRLEGYRRDIVEGLRSALGPREQEGPWTLRLESFAVTSGFFAEVTAPDGRKAWWVFDAPGEPVSGRIREALREFS